MHIIDICILGPPTLGVTASGKLTDPVLVLDSSPSPPATLVGSEDNSFGTGPRYLAVNTH